MFLQKYYKHSFNNEYLNKCNMPQFKEMYFWMFNPFHLFKKLVDEYYFQTPVLLHDLPNLVKVYRALLDYKRFGVYCLDL